MTEETVNPKPIDKWIPWFFVMFFAAIAAIDGVMVTIAVKTQPGVVTEHAYEKGLAYDQIIAAAAVQEELGWHAVLALHEGKEAQILSFTLSDAENVALRGAQVSARITRPVQDGFDFNLALAEDGAGAYAVPVSFPLPGQWHVRVYVEWQDQQYQHSQTVIVP